MKIEVWVDLGVDLEVILGGFWGHFGTLGWFFDERRGSKKRPKKREVKNEVHEVMATIDPTMVGPRVSP